MTVDGDPIFCERHGKPIDPESWDHDPLRGSGYCQICTMRHAKPMTPHTPGPWIQLRGTAKVLAGTQDENGHEGFEIAWPAKGRNYHERLANARLIAAAPELLAIVKHVYAYECERRTKDDHHFHDEDIDEWGEIIAKAEGGTP